LRKFWIFGDQENLLALFAAVRCGVEMHARGAPFSDFSTRWPLNWRLGGRGRHLLRLAGGVALLALLAGCAKDAPQDYLHPSGPIAIEADHLFKKIVFFAVIPVLVVIEVLLIFLLVRYRHRPGRPEPAEAVGRTKLRYIVAPAVILMFVDLFPMAEEAKTTFALAREPEGGALQVDVFGHMWWWEFVYPRLGVTTANELHIPIGRPVRLTLRSTEPGLPSPGAGQVAAGVLHSFWVPKLAGKQDVVPGRENKMTLVADEPGVYRGQCAEYCNLSHANMRLRVVAQDPLDFGDWVAQQKRPAVKPESGPAAEGVAIFAGNGGCVSCHTVNGVEGAAGQVGPNLTHLKSRTTFAGAVFDNTAENLKKWVMDPSAMKPMRPDRKTGMPDQGLSDEEIEKVVAFLETLQ
jgi:cytochrome c oxidase subunit 2